MLKLYNKEHVARSALTNLKDYKIEYLLSGEDLVEFSLSICDEDINLVEEECYIENEDNEYVIKAIDPSQNFKRFSCIVNVESIKAKAIRNFDTSNNTIDETIRLAIAGTGWILEDTGMTKRRTVRLKNTDGLSVLREIRKVFRVDYRFDAINKTIHVYEQFGSDKGVYFTDELNLKSLQIPSDTYDYATRLYCFGKEDLNIEVINGGKQYIENFQYSNKIIEKIWTDDRYTIAENLKEDGEAKLEELSKPKRSYQASIADLAKMSDEYKFLDFFLGDTITLLSKSEKFRDKQRIVKYVKYPKEPSKNTCELGNTTLTFEELQQENNSKNVTVDNVTSGNGTINGSTIDSIKTDQISDFETSVAKITDLTVINADIQNLKAHNVTITGKLTAIEGEFGTIKANVGVIDSLTVTHTAQINNLIATSATIKDLSALNATIGNLEATLGKIDTLVNGNLSSENIQAGGITSDKLTIMNGFITNAMIADLDVSKINAGDISTNKFRIKSDDGGIEIAGATQQFKDKNNRVRIQMGKDTQGNFNFIIRGEDGQSVLIDHTGIKQDAIANDLIVENMIANDAVGEKQIDYSSFSEGFNKDTNTHTLKATKIKLDNQNQTLDFAFNSLKTEVQGIQVGGRNLLVGFSQYTKENKYTMIANRDDYIHQTEAYADLEVNKYYTLSFKTDGELGDISGSDTVAMHLLKDGKYDYIKSFTENPITFQVAVSGRFFIRLDVNKNGATHSFWELLIESGNKPGDWTPAPEDVEGEINGVKEITTSQSTTISVMQGQISTAINNTTIIKDGQTILLKDDYNRTVSTVDSMKSTIGKHDTTINQHTGEITGVTTRVNIVERNLDSITSKVSIIETNEIRNRKVTSFRYIRDYLNGSTVNDGNHVVEIQVWANEVNIAQGKLITGHNLANTNYCNDGLYDNPDRYGTCHGTWNYMQLDLGSIITNIDMVKIWHYYYDNRAYNHKLAVSQDGINWVYLFDSEVQGTYQETSNGRTYVINESYTESRIKYAEEKITYDSIISTVSSQFYKKAESDLNYASKSQITQLDNKINLKVDTNGVISSINQTAEAVRIDASKIDLQGAVSAGGVSQGNYVGIAQETMTVFRNHRKTIDIGTIERFGYRLPCIYVGANGYSDTSTGLDGSYGALFHDGAKLELAHKNRSSGVWSSIRMLDYGDVQANAENTLILNAKAGIQCRDHLTVDVGSRYNIGSKDLPFNFAFMKRMCVLDSSNNQEGIVLEAWREGGNNLAVISAGNVDANICLRTSQGDNRIYMDRWHGHFFPAKPASQDLGLSDRPWKTVFMQNAPSVMSDRRVKENIQYINSNSIINVDDMYDYIKTDLKLVKFNYVGNSKPTYGFIAQDIECTKVGKEIVLRNENGTLSYDMGARMAILEGALQVSIRKIDNLEKKLEVALNEIETLKGAA